MRRPVLTEIGGILSRRVRPRQRPSGWRCWPPRVVWPPPRSARRMGARAWASAIAIGLAPAIGLAVTAESVPAEERPAWAGAPSMPCGMLPTVDLAGVDGSFGPAMMGPAGAAYNPALPSLVPVRRVELVGCDLQVGNGSLPLRQYGQLNGAHWDQADKDRILATLDTGRLDIAAGAELRAAGISWDNGSFVIRTRAHGALSIPKQALELLLNGNTVGEAFTLDGTSGEGILFTEYRLSLGLPLHQIAGQDQGPLEGWHAGCAAKILRGWRYARILEAAGGLTTTSQALYGDGSIRSLAAQGGTGFGADVGVAGPLRGSWMASLVVTDLLGWLDFAGDAQERIDSFAVSGLCIGEGAGQIVATETVKIPVAAFRVYLPVGLSLGAARRGESSLTSLRMDLSGEDRLGAARTARVAIGHARRLAGCLAARGTASLGGADGASLGGEMGWRVGAAQVDLGLRSWGSLNPWASRGIGLVATLNLTL